MFPHGAMGSLQGAWKLSWNLTSGPQQRAEMKLGYLRVCSRASDNPGFIFIRSFISTAPGSEEICISPHFSKCAVQKTYENAQNFRRRRECLAAGLCNQSFFQKTEMNHSMVEAGLSTASFVSCLFVFVWSFLCCFFVHAFFLLGLGPWVLGLRSWILVLRSWAWVLALVP